MWITFDHWCWFKLLKKNCQNFSLYWVLNLLKNKLETIKMQHVKSQSDDESQNLKWRIVRMKWFKKKWQKKSILPLEIHWQLKWIMTVEIKCQTYFFIYHFTVRTAIWRIEVAVFVTMSFEHVSWESGDVHDFSGVEGDVTKSTWFDFVVMVLMSENRTFNDMAEFPFWASIAST